MKYPHLFSELVMGGLRLPNRIMMAAMSTGLADSDGRITPAQVAYYRERARGGVGLITVEFACVDRSHGISEQTQVVLDDDDAIRGHAELVQAIQSEGALAALQLQMPGQFAVEREGSIRIAPSDVTSRSTGLLRARALEGHEVVQIIDSFASAARRAAEAGYDALQLHGAHGYLLHAFLSPAMNNRNDEWGGDEERRLRFPTSVVKAVKKASHGLPLIYRISAEDYMAGGLGVDDMARLAPLLVAAGVDGLDISTGSLAGSLERTIDPMSVEGWRFDMAARIGAAGGVPVAATGSRWPDAAEAALAQGKINLVALGRPLLADPFWAAAARRGTPETIRPCTSCNWCADRVFRHEPTGCAENPRAGRELVPVLGSDAGKGRRIVVVGGGPGGMAAAVQADAAGFGVTLFERSDSLGGGLITSAAPPHKDNLSWYRTYLVRRIAQSAVDVRLGVAATADSIMALQPDAVISASGAAQVPLQVEGEGQGHVYDAYALLHSGHPPAPDCRGPAVVFGGGETGCETAELLAAHGLEVVLVSRSDAADLARAAEPLYRKVLLKRLRANPRVKVLERTRLTRIGKDSVAVESEGSKTTLSATMVVLAQGRRQDQELQGELEERGVRSILVGDSRRIGRIGDAVHDANAAIRDIVGTGREPAPA
ncbi:FAD-dependent oxidoreductase [Arthrobacter sp. zg-ZUI100]|uniref:oxidoreductase n=1 Tax=Arthrobacter jiangjiafuii TaxID=2817475 RepID=UPI001AEE0D70|nr:FAD-dependent oxidoreductase [Arthrobacter jiangjiafuii]